MADKNQMSVEDILAACRTADGDGASSGEPAAGGDSNADQSEAKVESKPAAKPAAPTGKDPKEMSVADILAAARGGASADEESADEAESEPAAEEKPAAASGKKASEMSIAEIMAAARGGGGAADKPKPKPKAKPKAAAGKAKASPKAAAAPARSGPMDTSSILAAARSATKPGPISKSEAAAKAKPADKGKAKPALPPKPEKPAYAQVAVKKPATDSGRRGFMAIMLGSFLAIGFTTLSLTNLLWVLGLARFMFPNILIEPPSVFKVGFPGDFSADTVDAKFKAQFGVWVTNIEYNGQRQIVALKTVCTHLGCTPNWLEAEQKFKCPCHGSGFYKDGVNFEGPAPRPLERYAIRIADDGQLEVDKSKTFQEEIGQWNDPSCFVSV